MTTSSVGFSERLQQAWQARSARGKLLVAAIVAAPILVGSFALLAFTSASAGLERDVGTRLQPAAERGAATIGAALARAQNDARAWAGQDALRQLPAGSADGSASQFLQAATRDRPQYLALLYASAAGDVLAASDSAWIGRDIGSWPVLAAVRGKSQALVGPVGSADLRREVVQIAVAVPDPAQPGGRLGNLILLYDWKAVGSSLDELRANLAQLGQTVAAIVVDRNGSVNGGVSFDGKPAWRSALATTRWDALPSSGYSAQTLRGPSDRSGSVVAGVAGLKDQRLGWSVLVVERIDEQLAALRSARTRRLIVAACLLAAVPLVLLRRA